MSFDGSNIDGVEAEFSQRLAPFGFEFFAVCSIGRDEFLSVTGLPKQYLTTFPKDWVAHYISEKLHQYDPLLKAAMKTSYATDWRDLAAAGNFNSESKRVLWDASRFGIKTGVGLVRHNLNGSAQIVSLASRRENSYRIPDLGRITLEAMRLAQKFAHSCQGDCGDDNPMLSEREEECLTWVALGKSSAEVAQILSISANTVDFHLKRVMTKLDANSRVLAVVKAMRLGLISL